jgi:hypothetical protein
VFTAALGAPHAGDVSFAQHVALELRARAEHRLVHPVRLPAPASMWSVRDRSVPPRPRNVLAISSRS